MGVFGFTNQRTNINYISADDYDVDPAIDRTIICDTNPAGAWNINLPNSDDGQIFSIVGTGDDTGSYTLVPFAGFTFAADISTTIDASYKATIQCTGAVWYKID